MSEKIIVLCRSLFQPKPNTGAADGAAVTGLKVVAQPMPCVRAHYSTRRRYVSNSVREW